MAGQIALIQNSDNESTPLKKSRSKLSVGTTGGSIGGTSTPVESLVKQEAINRKILKQLSYLCDRLTNIEQQNLK